MKDKGDDAPEGDERKERVIHMRVAPSLDSELKERAGRLGVSVSNLVRNVLQHAFGLAGDVIKDGAEVARSARGEAPGPSASGPFGDRGPRPGDWFGDTRTAQGDRFGDTRTAQGAAQRRDTSVSHDFADPAQAGASGLRGGGRARASEPAAILGWQRFVLGLNAVCERCNALLPKGQEAGLGVLEGPGRRPIVCLNCFEELTRHEPDVDRAQRTERDDAAPR